MKKSVYIILTSLLYTAATSRSTEKLKVTILYESLCPDCMDFIQEQVAPTYTKLQDYIDINFVPFGKSKSLPDGKTFECQHGPDECRGNLLQSCALNAIQDEPNKVRFVNCQMGDDVDSSGEYCSKLVAISFDDILQCMNSSFGIQLQLAAERETNRWKPEFVPTIIYDDKFDPDLQEKSMADLKGVVCQLINGAAPGCKTSNQVTIWHYFKEMFCKLTYKMRK